MPPRSTASINRTISTRHLKNWMKKMQFKQAVRRKTIDENKFCALCGGLDTKKLLTKS